MVWLLLDEQRMPLGSLLDVGRFAAAKLSSRHIGNRLVPHVHLSLRIHFKSNGLPSEMEHRLD